MDEVGRSPSSEVVPPSASPTARIDPVGDEPRTRGFLFCDLRDYTGFVEAHGDRAAADLLESYRSLVRAAVARAVGAEIRTEGDSFYVAFPSASPAVRCGLDIVAAAATATAEAPDRPVRVGVGIHAGESVEGAEGYVGSAVNIAARVCAVAEPGEVLVTETVRGLVRTSLAVTFTPRGHPRLKGIAEPIALYRVTSGAAVGGGNGRRRSRSAVAALAIAGALVVLVVAAAVVTRPWVPGGAASPSPASTVPASAASSTAPAGSPSASEDPSGGAALTGQLAFIASQVIGADVYPRQQLYVTEAAGGGWKRVTELTDQVSAATWSPDGRQLVYLSSSEDHPPRIIDVATAPATEVWPWPWDATGAIAWQGRTYGPVRLAWSPSGELFVCAYTVDAGPTTARIFAVAPDGSSGRLVTEADPQVQPGLVDDCAPAVSPDGLTIAFLSGTGANAFSVWASASDGTRRIQVTSGVAVQGFNAISVSWSPDGSQLVFAGQQTRNGPIEIWTVDARGTNLTRLTDDDATDNSPAWSPDGRWIAWTRTVAGQRQIWVMAADGSGARPLVVGGKGEQLELVGWAPDPG